MLEFIGKTNIDFLGKVKITAIFSAIFMVLGITAMISIFLDKANMGIDFAGGTNLNIKFEKKVDLANARKALEDNGIQGSDLQEITNENRLLIRIKKEISTAGGLTEKIENIFREKFPDNNFNIESSSEVGPTIGNKLKKDALVAIILSLFGILIYLAIRFEFRFGVAAAIATFHDVFAVIGLMFLLDKEFTLLIVTAILTLAGYSLTDTVVIFDRIRENMKKRKNEDFAQTVNRAINEVLGRSIITSLTTLLVVISLFFFGGEVLHDFSLALIAGIIIGTYSSMFIASPIIVFWENKKKVSFRRA